jgi:glycosyltransferase involved in cell wall biosynthesis
MFFSGIGSSKLIQWSLHVDAPRIVHIHGIHFSHHSYSRVSWGFDLMETIPDMYICCAKDVERNMLRFLRVDPARLKTIYAGIDVAWFSERAGAQPEFTRESLNLPEDAFVVGAVGRVEPGKGTDLFVEAAAEVCRKHPELDIRFLWVGGTGQGRYADVISKRAWELQVEHRLDFVDSGPRPIDYVRMMDVLVSCSREEALPLVVLEAMALGKPVVGFPVGGVPEILGHGGGCLVSPFTPESLATAIEKIMMDPVLRSRLGRRGREVVETHFDIAKNVHCFESAIQEASNLTPRTTVRRAPGK